ncbi:MAG: MaoC/PaaZ C-terminal domain-containing protein, partial [Legionella sp.]|nr:MaoC/PaaZ C-terminal domain-containing protein [Legionella sp.]
MSADKVITGFALTEAVQRRFAQLSGDWNPMHLEGAIARRSSFGEPIAHGMNVVLTALELFRSHQLALAGALSRVPVKLSV